MTSTTKFGLGYCPSIGIDGFNITILVLTLPALLLSLYSIYSFSTSLFSAYQTISMSKSFKYGNLSITILFFISSICCIISLMTCTFTNSSNNNNITSITSTDENASLALLFSLFFLGLGHYGFDLIFLYQFSHMFFGTNYAPSTLFSNILFIWILLSIIIEIITLINYFANSDSNGGDGSTSLSMFSLSIINIIFFILSKIYLLIFFWFRGLIKVKLYQLSIDNAYLYADNKNQDTFNSYLKRTAASETDVTIVEREKTLLMVGIRYLTLYSVGFSIILFYIILSIIRYISIGNISGFEDSEFLYYINGFVLICSNSIAIICIWFQFEFVVTKFNKYCIKPYECCQWISEKISISIMKKQTNDLDKMIRKRKDTKDYQFATDAKNKDYIKDNGSNKGNKKGNISGIGSNINNNNNNNNNMIDMNEKDYEIRQNSGLRTSKSFEDALARSNEKSEKKKRKSGLKKLLSKRKSKKKLLNESDSTGNNNNNDYNNNDDELITKSLTIESVSIGNDNINNNGYNYGNSSGNNSSSGNHEDSSDGPVLGRDFSVSHTLEDIAPRGRSSAMSTKDVLSGV